MPYFSKSIDQNNCDQISTDKFICYQFCFCATIILNQCTKTKVDGGHSRKKSFGLRDFLQFLISSCKIGRKGSWASILALFPGSPPREESLGTRLSVYYVQLLGNIILLSKVTIISFLWLMFHNLCHSRLGTLPTLKTQSHEHISLYYPDQSKWSSRGMDSIHYTDSHDHWYFPKFIPIRWIMYHSRLAKLETNHVKSENFTIFF